VESGDLIRDSWQGSAVVTLVDATLNEGNIFIWAVRGVRPSANDFRPSGRGRDSESGLLGTEQNSPRVPALHTKTTSLSTFTHLVFSQRYQVDSTSFFSHSLTQHHICTSSACISSSAPFIYQHTHNSPLATLSIQHPSPS
jgi:hypothetical protein